MTAMQSRNARVKTLYLQGLEGMEAEVEASEGSILVDSEMEECKSIWATSEILLEAWWEDQDLEASEDLVEEDEALDKPKAKTSKRS